MIAPATRPADFRCGQDALAATASLEQCSNSTRSGSDFMSVGVEGQARP